MIRTKLYALALGLVCVVPTLAQPFAEWPQQSVETKPGARWWWMGSAVDEKNLTFNLEEYAKAGLGALEITPIYGVQGNDANDVPFLSERWMSLYKHTQSEAQRLGLKIDMSTGTGWPFGGPDVAVEDAASKLFMVEFNLKGGQTLNEPIVLNDAKQKHARLMRMMAYSDNGKCLDLTSKVSNGKLNWKAPKGTWRLIAAFNGHTYQQVKRAAPGGEGLVLNHFESKSVQNYLGKFTKAFEQSQAPVPHNFFNDSYEVYDADWTPNLFAEFEARRGYKLENYLPQFLSNERTDTVSRIVSDYRETLAELLLENFTRQWTSWANAQGGKTRNQAHGSPGNLIDLYAAVDVPECEGFGLSEFGIEGLRPDSLTRHNDSDLSMLKYASSAAHIAGKPYTTSETFTWLTEHFRTSFAQCKPDLDLMFVSGVNHMYFHGTTYSPAEAAWPGWKFYASIDMSPTNPLWRDAKPFFSYISRAQAFLQMGQPDNDFLVYVPVYDLWHDQPGRLLMFDIHKMAQRAPKFIDVVHRINSAGYDVDYISDNFIRTATCVDGKIVTSGGTAYKALVLPDVHKMPADVLAKLLDLARQGANIVFVDAYPSEVPGFSDLESRRSEFEKSLKILPKVAFSQTVVNTFGKGKIITGSDYASALAATGVAPEVLKSEFQLQAIRRSNETGHHYFISALKSTATDAWIPLAVPARSALFFDPMTGERGKAAVRQNNGKAEIRIQLASGQSLILKTFSNEDIDFQSWNYLGEWGQPLVLNADWTLQFIESTPKIEGIFNLKNVASWTTLDVPEARINMGTALYRKVFNLNKGEVTNWLLDLGDVRETARVRVNGQEAGTLWAVPFRMNIGHLLIEGENTLEIEVTSLPANRIAEMDRHGVEWRIFKEINIVDIHYKKTGYGHFPVMPAGLNSDVKLIPIKK
jgi:hypothetical protein